MSPVNRTVIHINMNAFSQQLLVVVPYNRVPIQRQATVFRIEDNRIGYTLYIRAVKTRLVKRLHLAVHRVRTQIERAHQQRIRMQKQAVALRIVHRYSPVGSKRVFPAVIVIPILTSHQVLIQRISYHHIKESLAHSQVTVVINTVGHQLAAAACHFRTVQQLRFSRCGVIVSQFRINVCTVTHNIRRSYNTGYFRHCIVVQCIRGHSELRVQQLHIIVENRLFRNRTVFSPVGAEYILFVHQRTSVKVVSQIGYPVVIQTVCIQLRVSVFQTHILSKFGYLRISVVEQMVTVNKKCIPLLHAYVTESFERPCLIVVISTVAKHVHTVMPELHISHHNLCIRTHSIFPQQVRVQQINLASRRSGTALTLLLLRQRTKYKQA